MKYRGFKITWTDIDIDGDQYERCMATGSGHGHRVTFMHVNQSNCMDMVDAWLDSEQPRVHITETKYQRDAGAWGRFYYNLDYRKSDGTMCEAGDMYGFVKIYVHDQHDAMACGLVEVA